MSISGISGATGQAQSSNGPGLQGTKDEFLKLFMAQLQHQDPFAPTSGSDMVAQLAQLSSVEQATQTNQQLADLAAAQSSQASAGLSSLVGRDCTAAAGNFEWQGKGSAPPLTIESSSPTKGASVKITNANGDVIRTIPIPDGTKSTSVTWDGKDDKGNTVNAGAYSISVDSGTGGSSATATWAGSVDAVELTEGGARLRMGGVLLLPADVRSIGGSTASSSPIVLSPGPGAL